MTKLIRPQCLYTKHDGSTLLKLYGTNEFYNLRGDYVETLEPFIDVAAKPFAIPVESDIGDFNPWNVCGMLAMHKETGIEYYILDFRNDRVMDYQDIFYVFNLVENEEQSLPLEFFVDFKDFEWYGYNQNYKLEDLC